MIIIRGLKGRFNIKELDLSDEEINEHHSYKTNENQDYVFKLGQLVQLTGYSDPIYAEAFVNIHKYNITFEILLVNRTNKVLQNVFIEFFTQNENKSLEKPNSVTL